MIHRNSCELAMYDSRIIHEYLQLSPYLTASRKKGRASVKKEGTFVRLRSLHDTYFYAHSFAPAYGRARATRIDKEQSALCRTHASRR